MNSQFLIFAADLCQMAVMPICFAAYVPQWMTLYRNKSSQDISLKAELMWACASLFAAFYAAVQVYAHGSGYPLLVSSLLNLSCLATTAALIFHCRTAAADHSFNVIQLSVPLNESRISSVLPQGAQVPHRIQDRAHAH